MGDSGLGEAVDEEGIDNVKWELDKKNQQHSDLSFCITRFELRNSSSVCFSGHKLITGP